MRSILVWVGVCVIGLSACSIAPFHDAKSAGTPSGGGTSGPGPGGGPVLTKPPEGPAPETQPPIEVPAPAPLPRERPHTPPATLSPASRALVAQAQSQRSRGDLPGATVSLERALRIEPNNPLLWIEMGRLRMDQANFPQAESMGRRALSMAIGDDGTQAQAWDLIGDSLKARGKNPQAEEAFARARELAPQ